MNKMKLTLMGLASGLNERLISACWLWNSVVRETEELSAAVDNELLTLFTLLFDSRNYGHITKVCSNQGNHPCQRSWRHNFLKNKMLPESLNSVQLQRWTERPQLSSLWRFSSSGGVVGLRKIPELYPARNTRKVLTALATSLWLCSNLFKALKDGVSKVEDTLPLSWMMRRSSSFRSTWSLTRTGGSEWHLLRRTSHSTLRPLRVRKDSFFLWMHMRFSVIILNA